MFAYNYPVQLCIGLNHHYSSCIMRYLEMLSGSISLITFIVGLRPKMDFTFTGVHKNVCHQHLLIPAMYQ